MKIGVSLFAVTATASVLSSSAFAGSYERVGLPTYETVSASLPAHTVVSGNPDYRASDPDAPGTLLRTKTSKATYQWQQRDAFDNSFPVAYRISHSATVTVKADAVRNSTMASGYANPQTGPYASGQTYMAEANDPNSIAQDTPHVSWTAPSTYVDYYSQFAQWGPFPVECTLSAGVFLSATAFSNTGAAITVSGSATVKTTEIKLITGP